MLNGNTVNTAHPGKWTEKIGNPLEWNTINKCLLIIGFWVLLAPFVVLLFHFFISHPDVAPFLDRTFMQNMIPFGYLVSVYWILLLVIGLWLRNQNSENHVFIYATVFLWWTQETIAAISAGPLTTPQGFVLLGQGFLGFLLFGVSITIIAIIYSLLLIAISTIASFYGIFPYAPLLSSPLFNGVTVESLWAKVMGTLYVLFFLLFIGVSSYIITRWRNQEKEVKRYSKSLNDELEKGRKIQRDFLPTRIPQIKDCDIAAYFHPALQLSGDFYDVFTLPGNRVGLVIADVSDKGVGSALFMALVRSFIRFISGHSQLGCSTDNACEENPIPLKNFSRSANADQTAALDAVSLTNEYIAHEHGEEGMFATLFFGIIDPSTGVLSYINGGHEPLIIVGADGIKNRLKPTGPGALPVC